MHGPFLARPPVTTGYANWFDSLGDLQAYLMICENVDQWIVLERLHITTEGQELWRQVEIAQVLSDTSR